MGLAADSTSGKVTPCEAIGLALATEQSPRASGVSDGFVELFKTVIEALPAQIALVDEHWVILAVNSSWTRTAALYDYEALRPGTNYAEFCEARAHEGHGAAAPAVKGIREINAGSTTSFHYLYNGNDRWEGYTFRLEVNRLAVAGRTFAIITRYDVTELLQLRNLRENFGSSLIRNQGQERRRVARDLHDSTQQLLVGVALGLGALKRSLAGSVELPLINELVQLTSEVQREIRSIAYIAHPPVLETVGLRAALQELVTEYGRRTGLATTFHHDGEGFAGWPLAETALYRVVQEALSNVHRHARASTMKVGLFRRKSMIHATVVDDGIGMPPVISRGVGLAGMEARLAELGGRLRIRSNSRGTTIIASVPSEPRLR